jgi:hypothetical protein
MPGFGSPAVPARDARHSVRCGNEAGHDDSPLLGGRDPRSGIQLGRALPRPFDFSITSISFVVRDLQSTISAYERLFGRGPFTVFDSWFDGPGTLLRGRQVRYHLRWSECAVAPGINLEFIQPLEGPGVWEEWLETKGESVYCVGTMMRTNEKAELARQWFGRWGIEPVMEGSLGETVAWYLLDTVQGLKAMVITGGGHSIDWGAGGVSRARQG